MLFFSSFGCACVFFFVLEGMGWDGMEWNGMEWIPGALVWLGGGWCGMHFFGVYLLLVSPFFTF